MKSVYPHVRVEYPKFTRLTGVPNCVVIVDWPRGPAVSTRTGEVMEDYLSSLRTARTAIAVAMDAIEGDRIAASWQAASRLRCPRSNRPGSISSMPRTAGYLMRSMILIRKPSN
jgi:hypothetical protein